ncbi:stabilizer of iron transporter SufD /Polynucleotidyl transferase [Striga asiatica]|uniref:Stabilizer of iron transporter SufD /Polynucleotidyl transferase n=1 Tax=Striga asiatica TaxID=4170 RepID=A0A5A7PMZ9_STRAF|nr:stabilizer of iron transporter SufD /Polynucleotidyl transferase [Striga asiatica]
MYMYVYNVLMQLLLLEEKFNNNRVSRRHESDDDFGTADTNKECKTLSSALEEVQHKGTLLHRLALLENRVLQYLQLSLEMDEGNTSKSSFSTVEASENTEKRLEMIVPNRPVDHLAGIKPKTQQIPSQAEGFVKEITSQHKGGHRKKTKTRWLGLHRLGC